MEAYLTPRVLIAHEMLPSKGALISGLAERYACLRQKAPGGVPIGPIAGRLLPG